MANSYLSHSQSSGNRTNWTLSAWVKRSKLGTAQYIMSNYSGSNYCYLQINPDNKMRFLDYSSGNNCNKITTRLFRDTNSWYHVVIAIDTTDGTAEDRFKLYINGERETAFDTSANFSSSFNTNMNVSGHTSVFGVNQEGNASYWDGYMSHIALVDGATLAPTVFGETDSTSGIWKFKSPSGVTWGTNGVHLKFENSGALGTDSSGNTNTYTVNGNLKQAVDTPSNVFATLNPLIKSGYTITYANGNNKATYSSSGWMGTLSTLGVSSGKWYWEGKMNTTGDNNFFGIMSENVNMSSTTVQNQTTGVILAKGSGDLRINNSDTSSYFNALSNGDIFSCALDLDSATKTIQFYKNGVANGSAVNLPTNMQTGFIFPCFVGNSSSVTINHETNFGNGYFGTTAITSAGSNGNGSLFEYDVPSGYYALNTKNINTYG